MVLKSDFMNSSGYIQCLKEEIIEKEKFQRLKDFYPENEDPILDKIFFKQNGQIVNFCAIFYVQDLTIEDMEKQINDYGKVLSDGIENGILPFEKSMLRGTAILIFSTFCPEYKRNIITNIEVKNIKFRLHIISVIVDLEQCKLFPSLENEELYYPDYPPGRLFIKNTIPQKPLSKERSKLIDRYRNEQKEIEKIEAFTVAFNRTKPYVTWALLILNIIMWILMESSGGSQNIDSIVAFGANDRIAIWEGQYWRLITSIFIHIGLLHLFGNCLLLYLCGPFLELSYGREKFLLIYILSGFMGSETSLLGMKLSESMAGISAGASGALFGVLGALISFTKIEMRNLPESIYMSLRKNLIILVLLNLAIGFIIPNVDIWAHIGGFFTGLSLGYLLTPEVFQNKKTGFPKNKVIVVVLSIFFSLFLIGISIIAVSPPKNLPYYLGRNYLCKENYEKAQEEFKKALIIHPDRVDIYLNLGITYLTQGKIDLALYELEKALDKSPDNPELNFFIGTAYHEKGNLDRALTYYQKTKALYSKQKSWFIFQPDEKTAFVYKSLGDIYRMQKKWDLAIENARKALEINPLLSSAHSTIGLIYLYQKKIDESEKEFSLALKLSSNSDINAFIGYALIYAYRGEFDKAINEADKIKEVRTQAYLGYIIESEIYLVQGKFDKAISQGKRSLDMEPDYWYTYFYLAKAYFYSGNSEESLPYFLKAIRLNCTEPSAYKLLALNYKKLHRLDDAIIYYSLAGELKEKPLYYHIFMAYCFYYNQNINIADNEISKALKIDPSIVEIQFFKAYILYNMGKTNDAMKQLREARRVDPYDDSLIYFEAYMLFKQGQEAEAYRRFSELNDHTNPLTYCSLAFREYIKNNLDEAKKIAEISLRSDKFNTEGHLILAMIAEKNGDMREAIFQYNSVLEIDPYRIEAVKRLKELKVY